MNKKRKTWFNWTYEQGFTIIGIITMEIRRATM